MIKSLFRSSCNIVLATLACVGACVGVASTANAAPITPTFSEFGELAAATFGGSGIPNDAVAIRTITLPNSTITLGLTATERFANPPVTNDGAGTFFAGAGTNDGTPGNPGTAATWNFSFYISVEGGTLADYAFSLLYDFDPLASTDETELGVLNNDLITSGFISAVTPSSSQGSQNSTFGFLAVDSLPFITAPVIGGFDADVGGEYSFALIASTNTLTAAPIELGRTAINVVIDGPTRVSEPAVLGLFGLGLLGFGIARRRKTA